MDQTGAWARGWSAWSQPRNGWDWSKAYAAGYEDGRRAVEWSARTASQPPADVNEPEAAAGPRVTPEQRLEVKRLAREEGISIRAAERKLLGLNRQAGGKQVRMRREKSVQWRVSSAARDATEGLGRSEATTGAGAAGPPEAPAIASAPATEAATSAEATDPVPVKTVLPEHAHMPGYIVGESAISEATVVQPPLEPTPGVATSAGASARGESAASAAAFGQPIPANAGSVAGAAGSAERTCSPLLLRGDYVRADGICRLCRGGKTVDADHYGNQMHQQRCVALVSHRLGVKFPHMWGSDCDKLAQQVVNAHQMQQIAALQAGTPAPDGMPVVFRQPGAGSAVPPPAVVPREDVAAPESATAAGPPF